MQSCTQFQRSEEIISHAGSKISNLSTFANYTNTHNLCHCSSSRCETYLQYWLSDGRIGPPQLCSGEDGTLCESCFASIVACWKQLAGYLSETAKVQKIQIREIQQPSRDIFPTVTLWLLCTVALRHQKQLQEGVSSTHESIPLFCWVAAKRGSLKTTLLQTVYWLTNPNACVGKCNYMSHCNPVKIRARAWKTIWYISNKA